MLSKRNKIIVILVIILIICMSTSGTFAIHNNKIIFKYTNKVTPYSQGTFENYTIISNIIYNEKTSGYLNISSTKNNIIINMDLTYYNGTSFLKIITDKTLNKTGNAIYFNNTKVVLPFFNIHNSKTLMQYGKNKLNYSKNDVSNGIINIKGLYRCHVGVYISSSNILAVYDLHSHLLNFICDTGNHVFSDITDTYFNNNLSYPILMDMFLHKTNIIVFPIDYVYVAVVYIVLAFAMGFFIIIPVVAILGITAYRKHRRKKVKDHGK